MLLVILLSVLILSFFILGCSTSSQSSKSPEGLPSAAEEISKQLPYDSSVEQAPLRIRPEIIGPGEEVTVWGEWPDQSEYQIYVVKDNEKYLVGKAGFNGGMRWNGIVEKTLKTLDQGDVYLPNDTYCFAVETDTNHWEGGHINLAAESVPIPPGAGNRMTAVMEAQIGYDLLSLRLNKYKDMPLPTQAQLQDYKIDLNDVNVISGKYSPLILQIKYSVLPTIQNSDWNITQPFSNSGWGSHVSYMTVIAEGGQFKINGVSEYPPPEPQADMFTPSVTLQATNPSSIAAELMNAYFNHFKDDSIPDDQRLIDFTLNEIHVMSQSAYGFLFYLDYTVQGAAEYTTWTAANGVIKPNGLVENKTLFVRVAKEGATYTMIGAGTSP